MDQQFKPRTVHEKVQEVLINNDMSVMKYQKASNEIFNLLSSEIKEAQIKAYENLKYDDYETKNHDQDSPLENGIRYERREFNRKIVRLISELREEGEEKV